MLDVTSPDVNVPPLAAVLKAPAVTPAKPPRPNFKIVVSPKSATPKVAPAKPDNDETARKPPAKKQKV
jgi:hypothetical protein